MKYKYGDKVVIKIPDSIFYNGNCGKPTPLGVGWIAKYFIINCV